MFRVMYRNDDEDLVSPKFHDILLFINEVDKFQRSDGWESVTDGKPRRLSLSSDAEKNGGGTARRLCSLPGRQRMSCRQIEKEPARTIRSNQPIESTGTYFKTVGPLVYPFQNRDPTRPQLLPFR